MDELSQHDSKCCFAEKQVDNMQWQLFSIPESPRYIYTLHVSECFETKVKPHLFDVLDFLLQLTLCLNALQKNTTYIKPIYAKFYKKLNKIKIQWNRQCPTTCFPDY